MANLRLRLLFIITLVLASHFEVNAQRTIGVRWEVPENQSIAIAQLEQFKKSGVSVLEIDSELSSLIWEKIDSLQFEVYGNLDIHFPVKSTYSQPTSSLVDAIQQKASVYLSHSSVSAIGMFEYGAVSQEGFYKALEPFTTQLKEARNIDLYHISRSLQPNPTSTDFVLLDSHISTTNIDTFSVSKHLDIGGYVYSPSEELEKYLTPFKKFTEVTASTNKPIFIHSDWLLSKLDKQPQFAKTLYSLASENDVVFPLPKETIPPPSSKILPIIILLLIWGTIGWHYNSSPLYRKSLFRYFLGHKFFIDDIFKRQIRSPLPAFTIILQNALLIAANIFSVFSTLFSPLGQTAFFYHFSAFLFFGDGPFSIFVWIFLVSTMVSFVSIIWLSFAHRSISSLTQVTTIYAWPLQLNFIFCTIAITLFSAGAGQLIVTTLTTVAVLIFLFSFIFISLDTLRFARSRFLHLIKTIIPYILVLGAVVVWVLTKEQWMEVINLSLTLK